ncbi:Arginine deiminase [Actinomyces bovis]|uniref:Arginine deiminase n=1 Tax=Actinomyces bovis TaxID=1658 RepID=A0ABY1VR76_9ACTO|nr:arginine deiminase [Actinomyces bovis]SPT54262.1 Arginine deiminase [Actinomyces bovis]VEG56430.1 Arginine deiminase [Actinomyces israelii]
MRPYIGSEIGELESVILHRPGKEMLRLTPENKDELLFDDVLWLERSQEEHDQFAKVLTDHGAEVLYLQDLLSETLEVPEARAYLIEEVLGSCKSSCGQGSSIQDWAAHLPAAELANILIAGITKEELLEQLPTVSSMTLSSMEDDDLLLTPLPNHLFTRDSSSWVYQGVSVNSMQHPARRRESLNYRAIYRWHPLFAQADFPLWCEGDAGAGITMEGGDIQIIGNDAVMIGVSERTSPQGVEYLSSRLFAGGIREVVAVHMAKNRAQMHLDTIMTMVDYGTFTKYVGAGMLPTSTLRPADDGSLTITENPPEAMHEVIAAALGIDELNILTTPQDLRAAAREQWNDGANTLAIAPGVVVTYESNVNTNEYLASQGITVHTIPGSELGRGRGGPHCMSCPVSRKPLP